MRRPEPLDPVVERDLATLEAALSGGPDAGAVAKGRRIHFPTNSAKMRIDQRARRGFVEVDSSGGHFRLCNDGGGCLRRRGGGGGLQSF